MYKTIFNYLPSPQILSWLILYASVFAAFSQLYPSNNTFLYVNSDSLGLAGFYYDIFDDGGTLQGWNLAAAPGLFPDMTLFFLVMFFLKSNVLLAMFIYALLQVTILTALLTLLYIRISPPQFQIYKCVVPVFISLYFIEGFCFSNDAFFGYFLTAQCYHLGPFLNSLMIVVLYLSRVKHFYKYLLLFTVTALASFSDKLFIVMLIAPMSGALLLNLKKINVKHSLLTFVVVITAAVIGLYVFYFLSINGYVTFTKPHRIYDFNNFGQSLEIFVRQMWGYILIPGFRSIQLIFTFLSIVACIVLYFKKRKSFGAPLSFFVVFYFLFCLSTFSAPIINGSYTGFDILRYNIPPFFLAAVPFALGIGYMSSKISYNPNITFRALLVGLFLFVIFNFSAKGLKEYINFYPDDVSEIDEVAKKYHLTKGIADYWTAKKTSILSKQHVKLLPVYANAFVIENGNNINAFHEGNFDFVIDNGLFPETKNLFTIKDTIKTKQYKIFIVEKFIYPKEKFAPESIK